MIYGIFFVFLRAEIFIIFDIGEGILKLIKATLKFAGASTISRIQLYNKFPIIEELAELDSMISTFDSNYATDGVLKYHLPVNTDSLEFCRLLKQCGYLAQYKNYARTKGYITIVKS